MMKAIISIQKTEESHTITLEIKDAAVQIDL